MTTVLIIMVLYLLFRLTSIIAVIIGQRRCLDQDTIKRFMMNDVSKEEREWVISHLGLCEKCQHMLHEHNRPSKIEDHLIIRKDTDETDSA